MDQIRTLRADEIECRVAQVKRTEKSVRCSLLLYKDARCDMSILDEVFGPTNWMREHVIIDGRLYCNLAVWDKLKGQWITKQDVGTESNTEKEKGQASDSFKRACTNWGIGRELYTAPFIWINLRDGEYFERNGKTGCNQNFRVKDISYSETRKIIGLTIIDKNENERYTFSAQKKQDSQKPQDNPKQNPQNTKPKDTKITAAKEKSKAVKKALVKLNGGDIDAASAMWKANYKKDENDIVKMNAALIDIEEKIKQVESLDA